jgi:hypothetical protein
MTDKVIMPCPFCKFKSHVDFTAFGDSSTKYFRIICEGPEAHALDRWDDTPVEAIEAWNNRIFSPTVIPEKLAEIIKVCDKKIFKDEEDFISEDRYFVCLANALLDKLDIREKE